jgi:hypothetical protein
MRNNITLTIVSLLSILFMSFHLTHDVVHGVDDPSGIKIGVLILLVWMCGTVMLAGRRSGYIITFLGGLFAAAMPVIHTNPVKWGFFFVWTLYALGVTGLFAAILSATGLWKQLRSRKSGMATAPASRSP